jgi:FkbH-like protein
MDTFLSMIEWQKILFGRNLNRLDLRSLALPVSLQKVRIHVYRNHAFEPVASVMAPFLAYSGITAEFSYGSYDYTFSFTDIPDDVDILLVWADFFHYKENIDIRKFLEDRIGVLRKRSLADIVVVGLGADMVHQNDFSFSGCYIADVNSLREKVGEPFYDDRLQKITATRLSNVACLEMARWLGLSLLPPFFQPNLKAIILDLDNTLYEGVLGEDGIDGLRLTADHFRLQKELKGLRDRGFFLGIASKNEMEDVREMFRKRKDFPLVWEDFSATGISWESKASNILRIAKQLRIAPDTMLFIDDNIGEISSVTAELTGIKCIFADTSDVSGTADSLSSYPGLFKWHRTDDDSKRTADLESNAKREKLQQSLTQEEYIKRLDLQITYQVNFSGHLTRVAELGGKTNQFIFSYARLKEQEIAKIMEEDGRDVVDFSLKDNLSDSGLIGAIITRFSRGILTVNEVFVSCRALGRGIEDTLLLEAIEILRRKYNPEEVRVCYKKGERNMPALMWLSRIVECELEGNGYVVFPQELFQAKNTHVSITVIPQ